MEMYRVRRTKWILLGSSLVFLVFLVLAAFEENFTAEWRDHQAAYASQLDEHATTDGRGPVSYPLEVRQIYLEDLDRIDRCVTCHVGVDNPAFSAAKQPLTAHPGDFLKDHPSEKFGCTICHQGQGRATTKLDAHAATLDDRGRNVSHWEEPLLAGDMVYVSCGRCHYENDLYGGQSDLYGQVKPIEQISVGELNAILPGADNIARGKTLMLEHGCLGCHKYRGRGGSLGPDITHVGEKTVHDLDFHNLPEEYQRTVADWMFAHFKSPAVVVPNTLMPELGLSDQDAHDLAAYMISLKRKSAPAAYTPLPQSVDGEPVRGETLYRMYCSSCHGTDGVGAIVRDAEAAKLIDRPRQLLTPSLRNVDTLGVASDAYIREIIAEGRPGTSMSGWAHEGLSDDEIDLLVSFIRRWEPREADRSMVSASRGNARYGAALFRANCGGCHGGDGRGGGVGVALRSPSFLAIASDEFLTDTILRGRANTAMPSWRQFDNREVSDLLAFLRSWQPLRSDREAVLAMVARTPDAAVSSDAEASNSPDRPKPLFDGPAYQPSASIGLQLYRSRCTVCHGSDGEGEIGPSLRSESVLGAVSNEFLHDTIVRGRPGTAMPAWRQLSSEDVADMIALMRSWQQQPSKELVDVHVTGDWQNGELLYQGVCASCHGPHAEGALGPQLSNPVFLETVSDATLIDWISYGRAGTQMRPNLRGQQGNADLSESQIEDIVTYLRSLRGRRVSDGQRIGLGFAPRGQVLFEQMCISCHGSSGEGASGPGIRNPDFLTVASDGFLRATIVLGRDGTEMRSMAHRGSGIVELRAEEIDDLIAYLRSNANRNAIPHRFVIGADLDSGRELYAGFCAGCHGVDGRGNFAPELNNAGFLRAATDGYLQATIIRGRRGTAMRAFGTGGHGLADLTQDQINDIVAYIRQWSPDTRPLKRIEPFPAIDGTELASEMAATTGIGCAATGMFPTEYIEALSAAPTGRAAAAPGIKLLQAACPYCGVGCGTLIKVEAGKVVGMVPDKKHPTNRGIQCIKGLNAHEPIYKDRLTKVLIRKDYSRPLEGYVSKTKGRFDDDVWREVSYEEGEEFVAERIAEIIKAKGGNAVGLNGSGQLTMEAQWIENLLMKGVIQSNSIEANARMCMTSAVAGYFHSYGSDAPPTSYEDIEESDFVTFWGHNAREAHPILFWRVADHKMKTGIATLVSDPRRTGTVIGLEDINPRNSLHLATLNGDISYLNAIGHVLWNDHRDACMDEDWLNANVNGWQEFVAGLERYSPEAVAERLKLLDRGRVTPDQIREAARLWAEASLKGRRRGRGGVLSFWGIGYNQMLHGQHNTISIINLHLLTGNVGRPGCGSHSQTGQPNAMSERLMGGLTGRLPFNRPLNDAEWRSHITEAWRLPEGRLDQANVSPNPGMVVGMMERALKDDLLAMFWMYTTHVHMPDLDTLVRPALTKMFCVVQDIYQHAPNLLYGDVIFPAATWGEWYGGTYIQSERRVYVCDGANNPPPNCRPDMDMAIDKAKLLANKLGLDGDKVLPYKKGGKDGTLKTMEGMPIYDPEEVFEDIVRASAGSDADLTGMLEVKEKDGIGLYDQIRALRGVQWPAPTVDVARQGGTPRRYLGQEGWAGKPYGAFRHKDGKAKMKLCEQDYTKLGEVTDKLMEYGHRDRPGAGPYLIDELAEAAAEDRPNLLVVARDNGLVPELPDLVVYEDRSKFLADHKEDDVYPFWLGLGIVYEHFHSAKTIRGATTQKLVPEQYVEMHAADAERFGLRDGDPVRIITRRGSYECRVTVGLQSEIRPSRSEVPEGYLFSPWNLSVADSADPSKNRWLVNSTSHRAWDPVSGQADYKKLAARIERI